MAYCAQSDQGKIIIVLTKAVYQDILADNEPTGDLDVAYTSNIGENQFGYQDIASGESDEPDHALHNEDKTITNQMVDLSDSNGYSTVIAVASYANSEAAGGDTAHNNETIPVLKVMMVDGEVIFQCSIDRSISDGTR